MNFEELKQAAMECLGKAFKGDQNVGTPQPHVVQAAVTVLFSHVPKP